ncbi:MAG TPA: flavin reductase family protein [candidate division Zixibacteria bacterium]|nr:flavin reductase family protein [candidate division Zixibacteria bacterium]
MQTLSNPDTAPFADKFFPLHLLLLTVGENMMPMGYWTLVSKDPFRFLISMGVGNHSLPLIRKHREVALHFMPWRDREKVVRAGWVSGRDVNKAEYLGFSLRPAEKLVHTQLVEGADTIFETVVHSELEGLSREFAPFVLDVVAVHGKIHKDPILFLSRKDFATLGDEWKYHR